MVRVKMKKTPNTVHLYFHSPCFDGTVSAAIASDYLELVRKYSEVLLHDVNYHLKDRWLATRLERPCAIVDFLYHTSADLWADHHPTAFLDNEIKRHYENRSGTDMFYDSEASSCAGLLWRQWSTEISTRLTHSHYDELVQWADRIDSARYESVEETILLKAPALQINLALAVSQNREFSQHLVRLFREYTLEDVAAKPEVRMEFEKGSSLHQRGLQRLKESIQKNESEIAIFDVNGNGVIVNRYAPFYFYPQARYSAGIIRSGGEAKLTAMRNPWFEFQCAPLGQLCASLGGGGHQRVGSILVKDEEPRKVLSKLLDGIDAWEHKHSKDTAL